MAGKKKATKTKKPSKPKSKQKGGWGGASRVKLQNNSIRYTNSNTKSNTNSKNNWEDLIKFII